MRASLAAAALLAFAVSCAERSPPPGRPTPASSTGSAPPFTLADAAAKRAFPAVVVTVLQVPSYTYVLVEDEGGARAWVATLKSRDLAEGARVRVQAFAERTGFRSRRLGRTFERLLFGRVAAEEVVAGAAAP